MEKHDSRSNASASSFAPRTLVAKCLWELRQEALASDATLPNLDEIRQELRKNGRRDRV
jgi:hypothetical protein